MKKLDINLLTIAASLLVPMTGIARDIGENFATIASFIPEEEFSSLPDVLSAINGKPAENQTESNLDIDYLSFIFGGNEDMSAITGRQWDLGADKKLLAVNYFEYEGVPKTRFFEVNEKTGKASEVANPIRIDAAVSSDNLIYTLEGESPDISVKTYILYDSDDSPMQWNATWNGTGFDVKKKIFGGFEGSYLQLNDDHEMIIYTILNNNRVFISQIGLWDSGFFEEGKAESVDLKPGKVTADCMFTVTGEDFELLKIPAKITLTQRPDNLYEFKADAQSDSDEFNQLRKGLLLFKLNDSKIDGEVPASVSTGRETMKSLLKALSRYVFCPELEYTLEYLQRGEPQFEGEDATIDEKNRYAGYIGGETAMYMDCKYWLTSDGEILLGVNRHDDTYSWPQDLRFYLFNPKEKRLIEVEAPIETLPTGKAAAAKGIIYQLRQNTDEIVALVPNGDETQVVRLKFQGYSFR